MASAFRLEDISSQAGFKLFKLVFDLPGEKVNKFSSQVMNEFTDLLQTLSQKGRAKEIDALIVVSPKPGIFIAGADIDLIRSANSAQAAEDLSRQGQRLLDQWEDLPFPRVVAINGAALGGGCEFSLASTAICMSDDKAARMGLPEVLLGIIPGMGGCVRLPRKIGIAGALDLILTGKTLPADRAFKAGLIEACIPKENFEQTVINWTKLNLKALQSQKRLAREPKLGGMGGVVGTVLEKTPLGRAIIYKKAREGVMSKSRGHYPSPLEAISVLSDIGASYGDRLKGREREKAMQREAKGFGRVAATDVSKNLIRIFFMTETVKKSKGISAAVQNANVQSITIAQAAVLGAGVMGGGIAQLLADKSVQVRMKDINLQALTTGVKSASKIFQRSVQKKRINKRQYIQKMNLITPVVDFSGFASAEVVIEAIIEKLDIKQKVFQELENYVSESCVIASNTSSLSVTEMQKVMKSPSRFVGMHFFNPVHKMPLVEVIRGDQSSDQAVSTIYQFTKQIGKTPIVVKDRPGFLVNRLLMPYLNEATWLLAEGAHPEELDSVILKFGMPMGPMELIDEIGVDVGDKVAHILNSAFGARFEPSPVNGKISASGRLGKKNGKGVYNWDVSGRTKTLDPKVFEILGVKPKSGAFSEEEIIERCILPMINEAARCLKDEIVSSASEVDLGMIMGTGFPPFRGGLLRYADSIGSVKLVEKLKKYHARFGARFEPAAELVEMAKTGQKFYSVD